ncbi:uncharacterized protein TNCV_4693891 [Trichonephila clavipes]|uniref:Uncharacterized protein n=1 Tax=Trichonephila clavipes TaxID=2585209 RepID=A0A8X7BHK1_TRICX|nr:uncharacterized protein TNCV_4693891 [Trichonephila clavipes]
MEGGKKLDVSVDHRKCDEIEIGTGGSDSNSSRQESIGFYRVQRRSSDYLDGKKKGSEKEKTKRKTVAPSTSGYNLRPRGGREVESRPVMEMKTQQGGPVRTRKSRGRNYSPYIEE